MDNWNSLPPILTEVCRTAAPVSWGITACNLAAFRAAGYSGKGEVIAVLDTGGDTTHPLLKDKYVSAPWSNVPGQSASDVNGHGRHCAGTAAGNNPDLSFATGAGLLSGKWLNDGGSGLDSWFIPCMYEAADRGGTIFSVSAGGGGYNPAVDKAGRELTDRGIVIVVAAGNERQSGPDPNSYYPARYGWAIRVASVGPSRKFSPFSNPGLDAQYLTGAAPGEQIPSAGPNGSYNVKSGTSMACPAFAGFIALMQERARAVLGRRLTTAEIRGRLANWCADAGPPGADTDYGAGLLDGGLALLAVSPPPVGG
jgi:subtilisin family serine protease